MLRTKDLSFNYTSATTTLQFPDIHCQTGEHWLLLGQSGSGKTTFLQLLAGLRTPKTGEIQIGNTSIHTLSAKELDTFRGKNIGIVFQQAHFMNALSIEENLQIAQKMAGVPIDKKKIKQLLERLNIGHKAKDKPKALSQGEQQRAAIARALVNEPTILLADEPTSALDDKNTAEVITLLKEQATLSNANLLIVTHDNRLKAAFENRIEMKLKIKN